MKKEYKTDIFNELDDDLINEAAEYRLCAALSNKKPILFTVFAASLTLIAGMLFVRYGFPLFSQNNESLLSWREDANVSVSEEGTLQEGTKDYIQELSCVSVSFEYWTDDGFVGIVTESVDTDAIPLGSIVSVKTNDFLQIFNENHETEDFQDMMLQSDESKQKSVVVHVVFSAEDVGKSMYSQEKNERVFVLVAEWVWVAGQNDETGE